MHHCGAVDCEVSDDTNGCRLETEAVARCAVGKAWFDAVAGNTRMIAIIPLSSCSRMWQ